MPTVSTFPVEAKGMGRRDYTKAVERSTQPFITPSLRQIRFAGQGTWTLPAGAWPGGWWYVAWAMPQDDGTWGWTASSVVQNLFEIYVSTRSNHLVLIGLQRFASWNDYVIYNVADWYPQLFGYGKVGLTFQAGIPTIEGSVYATIFGCWTDAASYEITVGIYGISTELSLPWMEE